MIQFKFLKVTIFWFINSILVLAIIFSLNVLATPISNPSSEIILKCQVEYFKIYLKENFGIDYDSLSDENKSTVFREKIIKFYSNKNFGDMCDYITAKDECKKCNKEGFQKYNKKEEYNKILRLFLSLVFLFQFVGIPIYHIFLWVNYFKVDKNERQKYKYNLMLKLILSFIVWFLLLSFILFRISLVY